MDLKSRINAFVKDNTPDVVRDIATLVGIPSVEGNPSAGAPFGHSVARALDAALLMADRMGLDAHNVDGYFGYADLPGKSEKQIATITHLDVVPEGNGWTQDPFSMQVREGWVIGRGVADDKGPAVLTLYAAKFFKEQGVTLPYTLRVMFGTNEETGMGGLAYYQKHYEDPAFCFTPDGSFPVCCGEKGIFAGDFVSDVLPEGRIVELSGGVASNVVPDRASALVRAELACLHETDRIKLSAENGLVRISAFGVGGHAAMPAGTVNAIGLVAAYLLENGLCTPEEKRVLEFLQLLHASTDGSTVGIASSDGLFDPLTCIGGMISLKNGVVTQNINVRYPTSITAEEIADILAEKGAAFGMTFAVAGHAAKPFYIDPESPAIRTLVDTYNEVSGTHAKPFTMGGGTYARHFKNAVSFGVEEEGAAAPEWVGPMHGANEGISIELLCRALKIYILAIARLMELEF